MLFLLSKSNNKIFCYSGVFLLSKNQFFINRKFYFLVKNLLRSAYFTWKSIFQGFFSIPVDNLRASPYLLQYIRDNIPDFKNAVIVAKSAEVMHKATSYADRLRLGIAVIHGEEPKMDEDSMKHDGRQSPPLDSTPKRSEEPDERPSTSSGRASAGGHSTTLGNASYELFPILVRVCYYSIPW